MMIGRGADVGLGCAAGEDQGPHVAIRERFDREPDVRQSDEGDADVAVFEVRDEAAFVGGFHEER